MRDDLTEIKSQLSIAQLWNEFALPGKPGKCVCSPFRKDEKPSFSVWRDTVNGDCFFDHGIGQGGDVFDFIRMAKNCNLPEAIQWAKEHLKIDRGTSVTTRMIKNKSFTSCLEPMKPSDRQQLAKLRGLSIAGLELAESRGLLWSCTMWRGINAWAVTDNARRITEYRRLDGRMWDAFGHLQQRKAHCKGRGKTWPVGLEHIANYPSVMFVEGAPDLIAAHHFIVLEQRANDTCAVAMLGAAANRIEKRALEVFAGKQVTLYPHCDNAGQNAVRAWALQLYQAGANVMAFDLSGLITTGGTPGKDLNDLARIDIDCWEETPKFQGGIIL